MLFTPGKIGNLELPNRLIRSATAERMADEEGRPTPKMSTMYEVLSRGGVGLIITGHMYVHPSGKAHPEMTGVYKDDLIPDLARLADIVHANGGKVVAQINHGGRQSYKGVTPTPIAPSAIDESLSLDTNPARAMTIAEIELLADAFAQAARRVKEAGFDGVQIHSAHGYLISQFNSPYLNRRTDEWGGSLENRARFLREVMQSVRYQVGNEYPVLIKFGMMDGVEGGLTLDEGALIVSMMSEMGLDGIELSGGMGGRLLTNVKKGIKREDDEGYFLPFAQASRKVTQLPLALVGGFRSKSVMEQTLQEGTVDFISICRPLINDPELPNKFREGILEKSGCISSNNCWAERDGDGISCKCPIEKT
ncbi:MAG: NADH:flavin oxidoreductase [Anaerolineales bacterium]|nr:NADH:flavin oxidoreductase [Chloroflexota bacterium]MBL6982458.1 NADH:flavin oxidoreductase [Anaerolineales bacterium]